MRKIKKERWAWLLITSVLAGNFVGVQTPVWAVSDLGVRSEISSPSNAKFNSESTIDTATDGDANAWDYASDSNASEKLEAEEIKTATSSDVSSEYRFLTPDGITLIIDTTSAILPEDTDIRVVKVAEKKQQKVSDLVQNALDDENSTVSEIYAYDISFWSKGEEFEPEAEVKITFQLPEWGKENLEEADNEKLEIFHVEDDEKKAEIMMKEKQTDNEISCWAERFSVYGVVKVATYGQINYKDMMLPYNVIMRMSDDCGVCSMATIEAYANKSTNHDYYWNWVYKNNGNKTYCSWGVNGYYNAYQTNDYNTAVNSQSEMLSKLYSTLQKGPCIVGNGHHFAVVVAYLGNGSTLNKRDFVVMDNIRNTRNNPFSTLDRWQSSSNGDGVIYSIRYRSSYPDQTVVKPPTIVSAEIIEQNSAGYLVEAFVKKGTNDIDRVQFPTWTEKNGQDDLVPDWYINVMVRGKETGTFSLGGGTGYQFWVLDKDHNIEKGDYITHIYAYDSAGNVSEAYHMPKVNVKNEGNNFAVRSWNGHIYSFVLDNLTWSEAKDACEKAGGHLATITSTEEQAVIEDLICNGAYLDTGGGNGEYLRQMCYIGGMVEDGKVTWITGEPTSYSPKWAKGQPDNYKNEESILTVYSWLGFNGENFYEEGEWNDMRPNSNVCGYICEIDPIPVSKIELSNDSLSLEKGAAKKITATVYPSNAYDKNVVFESSNTTVASVNSSGTVTAKSVGIAKIIAKAGNKTATCWITVENPAVDVATVELNRSSIELKVGEAGQLIATVRPDNASNKKLTWSVADNRIASVDSSGKVVGLSAGTTTVTVKAGNKMAVCQITVKNPAIAVVSLELNKGNMELQVGEASQLTATVRPDNASDKKLTWVVSDSRIASVDINGKVLGISAGTTTVTVTAGEKKASCIVTVKAKTSSSSGSSGGGSGSGGGGGGGGSSSSKPRGTSSVIIPEYVVTGDWSQSIDGRWSFTDKSGVRYTERWVAVYNPYANSNAGQPSFDWFRFDENGYMMTGWYQDTGGNRYYMSPDQNGTQGHMVTGWIWIADTSGVKRCYYFNPNSDGERGKLMTNTVIGGSTVNASGEWTIDGVVQTR